MAVLIKPFHIGNMTLFSTLSHVSSKVTALHAIIFILLATLAKSSQHSCFKSIIAFGDSIADTGTLLAISTPPNLPDSAFRPYGRTFFLRSTGRFSDGRLIIDFIAEKFGLPLVKPYTANHSATNYRKGVNFAVGGASALRIPTNPSPNVTLGDELEWFNQVLATIPDGRQFLAKSLVLVGIGGNDYNLRLWSNLSSPAEIKSSVPPVVKYIGSSIRKLIKLGAQDVLVPGVLPFGCTSIYLTDFKSSNKTDYDPKTNCLLWPNELAEYHNQVLKKELSAIRKLYPQVTVSYADYYNVAYRLYLNPSEYGFTDLFNACCGTGQPYNFNFSARCGSSVAKSCDDPSRFLSWDGIHFTESAYKWMAKGLIDGTYTHPPIRCIAA